MERSKKVKELRNTFCITQIEIAEKLGVAFISVNRYETGKNEPTMKVKRKLKTFFLNEGIEDK